MDWINLSRGLVHAGIFSGIEVYWNLLRQFTGLVVLVDSDGRWGL